MHGCVPVVVAALALLWCAAPASADLASLKAACVAADAADGDTANGSALPYRFCDDGIPPTGGTRANEGAVAAVAVPQRYDGVAGLPPKLPAEPGTGADANGDIALDVDVSLPDPGRFPPPPRGYPLIAFMHGCCSGDKTSWEAPGVDRGKRGAPPGEAWHYSNAWFASRGYVVLTYTARGFVSSASSGTRGSTGQSQLDDLRFELNDFQHLAGLLADDPFFRVDPRRVVATGGSYGGGFTWLALTDPTWTSPGGRSMALRAVAPRYGWTDLVQSLVPNGTLRDRIPAADGSSTTTPLGSVKRTILTGLFGTGATGVPPLTSAHATFPTEVTQAFACLQAVDPYPLNPLCATPLRRTLPEFLRFRSALYHQPFFDRLAAGDPAARVPVFSAGTFTDPLFPPEEHRFMAEKLKATSPGYPIQEYYGDYQHFVQNKNKEWADLCGADRHVCRLADYGDAGLAGAAPNRVRRGVTSRLNAFLDHYVAPQADPSQPPPAHDVTAALQICPETATDEFRVDEPGERFTAPSFGALATGTLRVEAAGTQLTTNPAVPNLHAKTADPLLNQVGNARRCTVDRSPGGGATAGPGVATYDSAPLEHDEVMIGRTRVAVTKTAVGADLQLNARLYDLFPDGRQVLVDRGVRAVPDAERSGTTLVDLHGNGWRWRAGHRVRLEIAQDDDPYIRASVLPSAMTISRVVIELPVRGPDDRLQGAPARCTPTSGLRSVRVTPRGRGLRIAFARRLRRKVDVDVFQQSAGRRIVGNRRAARFRGRSRSLTWSGRGARNGVLVVRVRMRLPGGATDVRRVAVTRRRGRFALRRAYYRRASCGLVPSFKLERPVLGGRANRALGIAFRLGAPARTTVTLLRGGRVVRRLRARRTDRAHRTIRLRLPSERLPRGELRIRLRVRPAAGGRTVTATLAARRL